MFSDRGVAPTLLRADVVWRRRLPESSVTRTWRRHSRAQTLARTSAQLSLALLAAWMLARLGIRWDYVADSPAQIGDLFGRMLPPDWRFARALVGPLVQTINIATLGKIGRAHV